MAGPHTENFSAAYDAIFAAQGVGRVVTSGDIAALVQRVLDKPDDAHALSESAVKGAATLGGAVGKTQAFVEDLLGKHART